jgi:hypothetical protein
VNYWNWLLAAELVSYVASGKLFVFLFPLHVFILLWRRRIHVRLIPIRSSQLEEHLFGFDLSLVDCFPI